MTVMTGPRVNDPDSLAENEQNTISEEAQVILYRGQDACNVLGRSSMCSI